MTKTEARNDRLHAAHERLQSAVEEIVSGDDWKRMLEVASKFHRYSFNNQLMIFLQRPDATRVAGFNRWKSLGRFVRKGEKGIAIFAPCRYKTTTEDENGVEQSLHQIRGFRVVHVFDISQTEGDELPDLDAVRPQLLDGQAPEGLWDALVDQATSLGFDVIRDRRGSENGYCDMQDKKIAVRSDVSPAQAVKTLIHELAHAMLHLDDMPKDRAVAELEVESVAFVVCDAVGVTPSTTQEADMPSFEDSASHSDLFSSDEWASMDFGSWDGPNDEDRDDLAAVDEFLVSSGAADAASGGACPPAPAPGDPSAHTCDVVMHGSYEAGDARFEISCALCGHIGQTVALADAETVVLLHETFIATILTSWEMPA